MVRARCGTFLVFLVAGGFLLLPAGFSRLLGQLLLFVAVACRLLLLLAPAGVPANFNF